MPAARLPVAVSLRASRSAWGTSWSLAVENWTSATAVCPSGDTVWLRSGSLTDVTPGTVAAAVSDCLSAVALAGSLNEVPLGASKAISALWWSEDPKCRSILVRALCAADPGISDLESKLPAKPMPRAAIAATTSSQRAKTVRRRRTANTPIDAAVQP